MNKIDEILPVLAKMPYLTKQNLGMLFRGTEDTESYWIRRLMKGGYLISIKKGFYASDFYLKSINSNRQDSELFKEYLSNIILEPSYISLEYALFLRGIIPEAVTAITSVSTKTSRTYNTKLGSFLYKTIKPELFFGWEIKEFGEKKIKIAPLSKALFDYFYFKKFISRADAIDFIESRGRFNWDVLAINDKEEFMKIVEKSGSPKMTTILKIMKKKGIV